MTIRIVIADDHQLFIDGIKSILSKEIGISIVGEVNNGLELLQMMQKIPLPDLILTDIRMPKMDGIAATKALIKLHPNLLVLALSMYDQPSDVIEMLNAGARGYLIKNASKSEMIKAIYSMYQSKEYFSPELEQVIKAYKSEANQSRIPLTRREKEILALIGKGRTSLQIGQELNISKLTVDTHRKNMMKKLKLNSAAGLIRYALRL
ncbi:MAG: response regulator transcription factor [Saprospiraceae bacterium]|nr:response regulator transcription factor [Saprospiraceae bacterium]